MTAAAAPNPLAPNAELLDECVRHTARQRNVAGRVAYLQKYDSPTLRKALQYAYDPFIRFGIELKGGDSNALVAHCSLTGPGLDITDQEVWDTLDDFRTSTASSMNKREVLARLFQRLNPQTAWLVVSILQKSLIEGVGVSIINKAFPDLIKVFAVQLAQKYGDKKVKRFPAYVEPKYDGIRCTAVIHPSGDVDTLTRTGKDIPAARRFHPELRKIGQRYKELVEARGLEYVGIAIDGEVLDQSFNSTVSTFRSSEEATSGQFSVFDLVPLSVLYGKASSQDYPSRRALLKQVAETNDLITVAPSYVVNSHAEIWDLYAKARELEMEGIIVKGGDSTWEPKRSNNWLKVKAEETEDLMVIGAFEGEGQFEGTLGGVIVDRNGVEVRVGSGFKIPEREVLWKEFLEDLIKQQAGEDDFSLIGTIMEIQFQEVTPDGSLRHPVFKKRRRDKHEVSF